MYNVHTYGVHNIIIIIVINIIPYKYTYRYVIYYETHAPIGRGVFFINTLIIPIWIPTTRLGYAGTFGK